MRRPGATPTIGNGSERVEAAGSIGPPLLIREIASTLGTIPAHLTAPLTLDHEECVFSHEAQGQRRYAGVLSQCLTQILSPLDTGTCDRSQGISNMICWSVWG